MRFLRLEPFDDASVWNAWIGKKAVSNKQNVDRLHTIGKSIILRRTKEEVGAMSTEMANIPPKIVEDIPVEFSEAENEIYQYLFDHAKEIMTNFLHAQQDRLDEMQGAANNYIAAGARRKAKKNDIEKNVSFSQVLVLLTRLRQGAVLPYLIKTMLEDSEGGDDDDDESYDVFNDPISAKNPVFEPGFRSAKIRAVSKPSLHVLFCDSSSVS